MKVRVLSPPSDAAAKALAGGPLTLHSRSGGPSHPTPPELLGAPGAPCRPAWSPAVSGHAPGAPLWRAWPGRSCGVRGLAPRPAVCSQSPARPGTAPAPSRRPPPGLKSLPRRGWRRGDTCAPAPTAGPSSPMAGKCPSPYPRAQRCIRAPCPSPAVAALCLSRPAPQAQPVPCPWLLARGEGEVERETAPRRLRGRKCGDLAFSPVPSLQTLCQKPLVHSDVKQAPSLSLEGSRRLGTSVSVLSAGAEREWIRPGPLK